MEDESQHQETKKENGCLSSLLVYAGIFGAVFGLVELNEKFDGLGTKLFGYAVLALIGSFVFAYLFDKGKEGFGDQLGKLIFRALMFMFIIFLLGQCSGGSGNCAYRVGCW